MPQSRDPQAIAEALRAWHADGGAITGVRPIAGGYSNETYLVEGLDIVLRLPPISDALLAHNHVHDVIAQHRIMTEYASRAAGPPVPRPGRLVTDPSVLGAPFFFMQYLPCDPWGELERPDWLNRGDDALRFSVCDQIAQMYARLHALAPLEAFGRPYSVSDELGRWHAPVRGSAGATLLEAFDLLFANAPADAAPTPCHGDAKIANILWKDGRLLAMIDYEMSFNGDPRWDIAALLQGLKSEANGPLPAADEHGFWGRDRFLDGWSARTGRSAARIGWFEAAARARYAAILTYGQQLADEGKSDDPRFAAFASVTDRLSAIALDLARKDAESA
jgi:aminoglycoside phosphotransferase (APT) family kinase protein